MSYRDRQRLADVQAAIEAIRSHLGRGHLSDGLVFDAVRIRLLEIGEAVKALPDELLSTQPSIPWRQIARMRDHLAHRYFDTAHAIVQATVNDDLPVLEKAVQKHGRLRHIWADGGYSGELVEWWQSEQGLTIEICASGRGKSASSCSRRGGSWSEHWPSWPVPAA